MIVFMAQGAKLLHLGLDFLLGSIACICGDSEEFSLSVAFWLNLWERVLISRKVLAF